MQAPLKHVVHRLRGLALSRTDTDAALRERFVRKRDEAAFAEPLRRHGPLVLGVCRRVLRNTHDAEDAFQATFLVLARRAASVRRPAALGNWLYGVAHRTALAARRSADRRRAKEAKVTPRTATATDSEELLAVLDEELRSLPEKYREAVVWCDLQGSRSRRRPRTVRRFRRRGAAASVTLPVRGVRGKFPIKTGRSGG
jgi:RNA polymerase sigma factor (sigma-70 family)